MTIRRERIMAALTAALVAGCAATVERNRRAPVTPEEAPHLNVVDGGQVADYQDVGDVLYTMRVDIDGWATAAADDAIGAAVNALYAEVLDAIAADISLSGACEQVQEASLDVRIAPVAESAVPLADFTVGLEIIFRTPDGDPAG